jgi:glycolate oxidase iron-sulfur subunit
MRAYAVRLLRLGRIEFSVHTGLRAANIDAWIAEIDGEGPDAIVITASGCGTTIKDYAYALREDRDYAEKACRVSSITKDITEYLADVRLMPTQGTGETVAYHSACSLQHGQQVRDLPKRLLKK